MACPGDPEITPALIKEHGLTPQEYASIVKILGRIPTYTELGMFSVMWSEHCSYKNSRPVLKQFPTKNKRVIQGPGENAGVMDIGDGRAICFKVESHNHPSAIEPYQGAATGVGGILRDIFTMGARPVACMNSLRFGKLNHVKARHLFDGVVAGIAGYGNCIGVPTIGGEVVFDDTYLDNCLVNVMAIGFMKHEELALGRASGVGNHVFYIGSTTGRDGIHGATFASDELSDSAEEKRSAVQVADPFMEKLLLEATLELIRGKHLTGIQDMGAAGLTCATSEMAARGKTGMDVELDKVPQRETKMVPYEILLSESQERMLLVAKPGHEKDVKRILKKWGLHVADIGKVTNDGMVRIRQQGKVVVEIPAGALADTDYPGYPTYIRPTRKPAYLDKVKAISKKALQYNKPADKALLKLLASPNLCSKRYIWEQYDHMVRTNTTLLPGAGAAMLRIKHTRKAVSVSTDGNGRFTYLDPHMGGRIAVAEAARNVAVTGAEPLGVTDCLNFGNPMDPEIFWQFKHAVRGMAESCRALGTPVTGGNVSFYNESPAGAVDPTPVVGVVGLLEDIDQAVTPWFKSECDCIVLLGETFNELGGSSWLYELQGIKAGPVPVLDLKKEVGLQKALVSAARSQLLKSAQDCSEGGLAVALAECTFLGKTCGQKNRGAELDLQDTLALNSLLFSESQSRVIVSVAPEKLDAFKAICKDLKVPCTDVGTVTGDRLVIRQKGKRILSESVVTLRKAWEGGLKHYV
ncbi:phosphoribosylformylglycinamidine synthase subunit PurL [bacterium]|nr:phosphoribosylformylglycinamidine synthase subunit PurL [bacterium]